MIKVGSSRIVLLIGSRAIKIPFSRCGVEQSRQELETWGTHKHKSSKSFLCPIKWNVGPIVVQERTKPMTQEEFSSISFFVDLTEMMIPEMRFRRGDLWRHENWGKLKGLPVLIDYGLNHNIERKYYKNIKTP